MAPRALGLVVAAVLAVGSIVTGSGAAAAVETEPFCAAYTALRAASDDAKVIRKQTARMIEAAPPRKVAKALATIRSVGDGKLSPTSARVAKATSTLTTYAEDECAGAAGGSSSGGSSAASSRCPLTESQVNAAVGEPLVLDPASCTFFPADDAWPNVVFVRQLVFACDDDFPAEAGYSEALDGLGERAYVQRGTVVGTSVLVCTDRPFEITVDMPDGSDAALAVARRLASEVLAGS